MTSEKSKKRDKKIDIRVPTIDKIRRLYESTVTESRFVQLEDYEISAQITEHQKREFFSNVHTVRHPNYYLARWQEGVFDSVGDYYTIGPFFVEKATRLSTPQTQSWTLTGQDQYEYEMKHPRAKPTVLNYVEYQTFEWGPGGDGFAVREKLNGTPVEVINGMMYTCGWEIPTPGLCEGIYEMMPDAVYQLYPYIENDYEYCGVPIKAHKWTSGPATEYLEGMIILTSNGEKKVKRYITYERESTEYKGVFEYAITSTGEYPIRPRVMYAPGKLYMVPTMLVFLEDIPIPPFIVRYGQERGWNQRVYTVASEKRIVRKENGFVIHSTEHKEVISRAELSAPLSDYVVGAKMVVFVDGEPWVFKDKNKHWDLIGGKIDPGESAEQALRREFREEAEYNLTWPIQYLCETKDGRYITHVFKAILPKPPEKPHGRWKKWDMGDPQVTWLSRLIIAATVAMIRHKVSFFSQGVTDVFGKPYNLTDYSTYSEIVSKIIDRESMAFLHKKEGVRRLRDAFSVSYKTPRFGLVVGEVFEGGGAEFSPEVNLSAE